MDGMIYQFENYLLDVSEQRLQKDGHDISLPPKVFEVLTALVKRPEQLVTYQELMDEVWEDTFVEETNLRYSIHYLRKSFDREFIETVPKRGYRFNCEVKSYTVEEFIKQHTGNYKLEELIETDAPVEIEENSPESGPSFFSTPAGLVLIAVLMTGIGVLGYYLWQNMSDPAPEKSAPTVVVLPFNIIGEDPGKNIEIRKGLAASMVFELKKIKGLRVFELNDPESALPSETDPRSIGQKLSADLVLEGSGRYEGEQTVQVNASLLQVSDGQTLFADSLTAKDESRIKTEKIISQKIARKIYEKMASLADEKFVNARKINDEAAKNYLNGQEILRNNELNRQAEGLEAFEKVIKIEPDWPKGYAKYAEALVLLHGGLPDWEKAGEMAKKALELDKNLPEAHLALGWYYQSKFDWKNAESSFQKAIELDPEYSAAYNEYGLLLDVQRKFAEAEKQFLKAIELKPFDPFYFTSLCQHYYYDYKSDLAVRNCREALNIDANFTLANKYLFWIYVDLGAFEDVFQNEFGALSENEIEKDFLAKPLKDGNLKLYWQRRIEDRIGNGKRRYSPMTIASFYAQLADKENTLKYLEEMDRTFPIDVLFVNPDPAFDIVRQEPRFINLMRKYDLTP